MKKLIFIGLFIPFVAFADDSRDRGANPTSVIEDSMCIPAVGAIGCLHVDEDVSGLIIKVIAPDGSTIATYDDGTEIEDIAAIGTYAAPNANNVRVSPQANGGSDLTQMMFADSVYNGQDCVTIDVSDGETTIMDFQRIVCLAKSLTTAQSDLDTITGSDGATISTASIQAFWDIQCEDQGSGLTCQEAMSILLAEAAGTAVYTSGTRTWVVKDPSGTETRLTIVYGAELDGDRSTSTLAPITP